MENVLSPAESGKFITENSSLIDICEEGVQNVARMILSAVKDGSISNVEFAAQVLHPKDGGVKAVDWVFLMDTINFSFWPDKGAKYDVTYKGVTYTGYFAGSAAVNKALDEGLDVTSAEWMAAATEEEVDRVFMSDSGYSIPLLKERVKAINDSGKVLLEKWQGSFINCIRACEGSAKKLLDIVVENFESFRDFAVFKGQKVSLLKRAQILVADVCGALQGTDVSGDFADIGVLTMFADYRVPQALAFLGALKYSPELLARLGEDQRLDNGCEEEVALRGASIWACELIVSAIRELAAAEGTSTREVCAAEVDMFLWVYRRQHAAEIEEKISFHRTRCIYY